MALLCCPQVFADSIMDRMRTRDFSSIDYMGYVLTMWYNGFFNYPFVVRVSIFMILICCISMVFFTISISVNKHFEGRRNRIYNRYYKRFYDIFCEITLNKDKLTRNEIDEHIALTTRDIARRKKPKYMFALCMLLVQVKSDYYNEYNYRNVRTLCDALAIEEFMERMLVFGSRTNRRRALQISQFMMIDLPESVLVRLLNSVNQVIRKETRMYYLWLSDYNPFRFFMESELRNYEWREWDALEIHFLMRARHIANKEMPSLPPIIAECENEKLQACLIREVGYWGTAEDIDNMKKYLAHKSQVVRQATIECIIKAHLVSAEPLLMAAYAHQNEHLRLFILRALVSFNTGRAVPFFLKAWSESKVQSTKLNIIMSLSVYGDKGMEEFERLERECTDKDDSFLFKQVRVFDSYIKNLAR